jgi:hypothetical protein
MPAKKKTTTEEKKPTAAVKTKTAKAPAKKAPAKKAAAPKKAAAVKKAAEKAPVAKKAETPKKNIQEYKDVINWKKWEAHNMDWLYIEINAGDLLTELEAGADNIDTCCKAILDCMLEGDGFIVEPKEADKINPTLTVRYYCDNLSEDRRKYSAAK